MKRDLQKRPTYMKRDPQKRPTFMKRDLQMRPKYIVKSALSGRQMLCIYLQI